MENFKKALKQAILEKAEAVRFESGQSPHLLYFASEKPLSQLPVAGSDEVLSLIDSLVANGEPLGDSATEGVLAIVNFGELKLIAQSGPKLRLFAFIPPQGNQLYQQTKGQILGERSAPQPINIESDTKMNHGMFNLASGTTMEKPPMIPSLSPIPIVPDAMAAAFAPGFAPGFPPASSVADVLPFTANNMTDFASVSKPVFAPVDSTQGRNSFYTAEHSKPEFSALHSEVNLRPAPGSSQLHAVPYVPTGDTGSQLRYAAPEPEPYVERSVHNYVATPDPAPETEKNVIHFGAFIPGETIERNGRVFPIDSVLRDMIQRKASDLHATMGEVLCMRIDGEIERVGKEVVREDYMKALLDPIIPPRNREEFSKGNDTDFAYEIPGLARFRVNIFRDRMGVGAVLRQIPEKILSADALGLPPAVRKFCELSKGLVVVTGPTGSGKSTTLAGMVDLINDTRSEHILTIEDPIEFVHKQKNCLLNQREVHKHTTSFSRALRAALREDPDIILIGEMRDLETVEIAIETAETGHLVFGTLHTNTAISTVDRLIDQFPSNQQAQIRVMLAESLKGVVAQTLVRKKGGGRVAALEILVVDKAVAALIREGNTHMMGNHMQTQKAKGNIMLNDSLLNLVLKGVVDAKDAYMKAIEKDAFLSMLTAKGITLEVSKSA